LISAGCHAVDALRWCTGLEAREVSAYQVKVTRGYEWPTSIVANLVMDPPPGRDREPVLAQLVSSTDFQMPYAFGVEMMGDRATLRDDLLLWNETPLDCETLARDCPVGGVAFLETMTSTGAPAIRIVTDMPGSADVTHHPFQGEIDELIACVLEDRETHLNVFDAERTMRICLAADRSAGRGGRPVRITYGAPGL
jgi:predicted dehydrogenase